jgi:hypothetical protein
LLFIVQQGCYLAITRALGGLDAATELVDVYDVNPKKLAKIIDDYIKNSDKVKTKNHAYQIGLDNFSVESLKQKYINLINE